MKYIEEIRKTPVAGEWDVLVAGGGIAGVAAALSSARAGAKTLLVEREYMLGGLGTAGLIAIYLPLCDGAGHQVSFGIAEELLRLSIARENKNPPVLWLENHTAQERKASGRRYDTPYNPWLFALDMETLLLEAGVEIRYGMSVCAVQTEAGCIRHAVVESKSGREAISVKAVVDATGDADICHMSGEDTEIFRPGNILAGWYYSSDGGYHLRSVGSAETPAYLRTANEPAPLEPRRFTGLDAKEISEMMFLSHKHTLAHFEALRAKNPQAELASITVIPQLRMTRRIKGLTEPDHTDAWRTYEDCVGMIGDWRRRDVAYQIPMGMLCGGKIQNLFAAGRCAAGKDGFWEAMRVIPACAVTGEAAGLAAALWDGKRDVSRVQNALKSRGVPLNFAK